MNPKFAIPLILLIALTGSLHAFLIPVWDITALAVEGANLKMEFDNFTKYIKLYTEFKEKLDLRVSKLIDGYKGLVKGKITSMGDLGEGFLETLKASTYYAQYVQGTVFDRVEKGEKLLDIIKERYDIGKELKQRGLYKDPEYKKYIDEYLAVYEERITRLEDRIKYILSSKKAGDSRLAVFETRYQMFEDIGTGEKSDLGGTVGNEVQAISLLSESMIDTALQDQEISTLLRLRLEEDLSKEINKIYLNNLMLIISQKKRGT